VIASLADKPGWSGCHGGHPDDGIIAQGRDCFQRHIATALEGQLVILFEQDRAEEAGDGGFVTEDADDLGAPFCLAVQPFDRVRAVQHGAVRRREAHIGEHIRLCVVHQDHEFRWPGP